MPENYSFDLESFKKEQEEKAAKRKVLQDDPKQKGSVYFHICNSGITFTVQDEGWGPTIVVSGGSFGNMQSSLKLHVDTDGLRKLGQMFLQAADGTYSEEYCNKAEVR